MQQYINSARDNFKIKEEQFEKILKILGIGTRVQFVVERNFKALDERSRLAEQYYDYTAKQKIRNGRR